MSYDVVIGCEVHVQLLTDSKAFCTCQNKFGGEPNPRVCPICMGLPGTLPVTNRALLENAVLAGLALNCDIAKVTKFDRKNYIYPDLPKGYQISQFDMPICTNGHINISNGEGENRKIRILRLHMEEDAGKNIHPESNPTVSFVDYNRCGTPLLEIVSEPDLRSPEEASTYVQNIREIMQFLGVSDCNMEEGSLRCDANINLWIYEGGKKFATPIAELKNMNSFRSIRNALTYEVKRQLREWKEKRLTLAQVGKTTRGFDEERGVTVLQREKEEASDYRYFPEPDLKPISISSNYVGKLRQRVGELPAKIRARYVHDYGISERDAGNLTSSKAVCAFFDDVLSGADRSVATASATASARGTQAVDPKKAANWILTEVKKYLNANGIEMNEINTTPAHVRELLLLVDSGRISGKIAKEVFVEMADTGEQAGGIVKQRGLEQVADESAIEGIIIEVVGENPSSADDYRNGKGKAIGFLMGQVMKKTHGKANPQIAMKILRSILEA